VKIIMRKVLVYPCGTEIGLEIYKAVNNSIHYDIYGGSSNYDHGRFVYRKHIDNLPFIKDDSTSDEIIAFNDAIKGYNFDYIYPAMDGVVTIFSKYRDLLDPVVIAPSFDTAKVTRSKKNTYKILDGIVPIPRIYESTSDVDKFPVFIKPDVGQGSTGARKILNVEELSVVDFERNVCMELLPGEEYTIDCFTNSEGKLIYCRGRGRKRIKNGISVNAVFEENPIFLEYAKKINSKLEQKGGWFFQVKKAEDGALKLLEVASRIAGTSAISRCCGANLPLLTLDVYRGINIDNIIVNKFDVELDRALENRYKVNISYDAVYVDYDDTIIIDKRINTLVIKFLFQCINNNKKIILLSKHEGNLIAELEQYKIKDIFDEVIRIGKEEDKSSYVNRDNAIFIDDSYGERKKIKEEKGIYVFDTNSIECLLEE